MTITMFKPALLRPLFALALVSAAARLVAAAPPAEKLLPDDTLVMLTAPDSAGLRATARQSPMGQLWNDPVMKPFTDSFTAKLQDQLIAPLERELGIKLGDYASLAQGQFTVALTANGWHGGMDGKPGALLLLDSGTNQTDLEKALADFRKKWTDAGKPLRTEKVRDVEFMVLTLSTNDVPATLRRLLPGPSDVRELGDAKENAQTAADAGQSQLILGRVNSLFIAGNVLSPIERVVGSLTGGSAPVLADVPQFQACQPAYFRDAQAFGWANARLLVQALGKLSDQKEKAAEEAPDPFATIKPEKILGAVGLSGLRNVAFAFQDTPEGALVQFHVGVPEAERKGLLKILAGEAKETAPPPFVPADAVKFSRWRMDGQKTWTALTSTLNEISPAIMSTVDFILNTADEAGKQKDEKFDLRRQVIGNLGDDIISFEKAPRGSDAAAAAQPPQITMIASKSPEEMVTALKVVFGALTPTGKEPSEREFLGRKIYTVTTMAVPQADPTNPKPHELFLSSSGGYVLLASDAAVLEEYLRSGESQPKPLRELTGLADAMAKVTGPGTSFFGFENQVESQRLAFNALKKTNGEADTNNPASGMTPIPESFGVAMPQDSLKNWFDYSLLPPFDAIAKYYSFTVYGGSANVDGLTLKIFAPTPPALRK